MHGDEFKSMLKSRVCMNLILWVGPATNAIIIQIGLGSPKMAFEL